MPLGTRPNQTYERVLSTDAHLARDQQPVFIFRYLNVVEWEEIASLSDKFDAGTDTSEMLNLAFQVIEKTLCGWRNMKMPSGAQIPYDIKRLRSMVTLAEATELMQAAVDQRPRLEDKKKSESRSRSASRRSAKTAGGVRNAGSGRRRRPR